MVVPYIYDIMAGVVGRVNTYFSTRSTDRFEVFFEKGLYNQTWRAVAKDYSSERFPLVWFEVPEKLSFEKWQYYAESKIELYIMMPTDNTYTQQERDDISFTPRLVPIYERLIKELKRERWFQFGYGGVTHTRELLPFWKMGVPNGIDDNNIFNKKMDAIRIFIPTVPIKKQNCDAGRTYPVLV